MNKVVRTSAIIQFDGICRHPFQLTKSFFHSSPILERRRRTNWESASRFSNYYNKRSRKLNGKRELLRNVSAFAEDLFQNWRNDHEEYHPSSSRSHPWFRQDFSSDRNRGGRPRSSWPKPGNGRFDFCEDDGFEVEDMFRAAFGGNKYFYCSFTSEEPEREYTSSYHTRSQRNRRHPFDDEYESSEESNCSAADLTSYRRALGLKSSGPLNLEDVKNAYRASALKWHPDRHQGPSKAIAEEKFKICSAAYQSLCDQLIVN